MKLDYRLKKTHLLVEPNYKLKGERIQLGYVRNFINFIKINILIFIK